MTPRAPRICPEPGCSALIRDGAKRCPEHYQPFAGARTESSRATGRRDFQKVRRQVFERDGNLCRAQLFGCEQVAVECHHLDLIDDHGEHRSIDRLIAVCHPCHVQLTAAQKADRASSGAAPPPSRRVRGRGRRVADVPSVPRTIYLSLE